MAEVVSTGVSHMCDNSTVSVNFALCHVTMKLLFGCCRWFPWWHGWWVPTGIDGTRWIQTTEGRSQRSR